jgi:hypothetical protein
MEAIREETTKFTLNLANLFSDDFDRKTLWERIGNGLINCVKKSNYNLELFVNLILEYIKAEPGKVAANEYLESFLFTMKTRPVENVERFLKYIEQKHFLVIIKARHHYNTFVKGIKK